jgi:spore maturation protein CgeB
MRILTIEPGPAFSVADVHRGWLKAFRQLGCEIVNFNLSDRLTFYGSAYFKQPNGEFVKALNNDDVCHVAEKGIEAAVLEVWPDLVFVTSGFFVSPAIYELLRARGMTIVLLHLESPYEDVRQMGRAALADVNIINDPTNLESFRAANPNTWYIPQAYDPDLHRPGPAKVGCGSDFCFVGTGYPSRVDFFEAVDWDGLDVALAGNWQATYPESPLRKFLAHDIDCCCPNEEAVDLYRATKASANLYRREAQAAHLADGWSSGPREIELAATRTFFLRESRGEGDALFPMLPIFTEPGDFDEHLRWWLAHEDQRTTAALAAQLAVSGRTFENNAKELLRLLSAL